MALYKIESFFPDRQQEKFLDKNIKKYPVYAENTEARVGFVRDVLVDDEGRFRYFVVETGFWVFGKKVLLPVGRAMVDSENECIYAKGIDGIKQAENLPVYHDDLVVDFDYEESVRTQYRTPETATTKHDRDTYNYEREPELYQLREKNGGNSFKLYEERLIANKKRHKSGEVSIGKKVETETDTVSVPVEKERVVIERHEGDEATIAPESVDFETGEVASVDVYEETANIEKQTVVKEEVSIKKEVERDSVEASETLRKEELEIDPNERSITEKS